ncbi:MAG TPA: hypothetical protein VJ933_05705 [Phaeodactylibacter sp.]|nr:hypothetical protein [Phaeodactylibacter sp.]
MHGIAQPVEGQSDLPNDVLAALKLRGEEGDSLYLYIRRQIRSSCGTDYDCLQMHYDEALTELERAFKHSAGILVAKEMLALAKKHEDTEQEEQALRRLISLYGFLRDFKADVFYRKQLITYYEETGNTKAAMYERARLLEGRVWYMEEAREVLPKLEAVLERASELGYTDIAHKLRIRLKYICEEFGMDDKLVEQIKALERISLSSPLDPSEYSIAFHAASGRADLFLKAGQYAQAEQYYRKALNVFKGGKKTTIKFG